MLKLHVKIFLSCNCLRVLVMQFGCHAVGMHCSELWPCRQESADIGYPDEGNQPIPQPLCGACRPAPVRSVLCNSIIFCNDVFAICCVVYWNVSHWQNSWNTWLFDWCPWCFSCFCVMLSTGDELRCWPVHGFINTESGSEISMCCRSINAILIINSDKYDKNCA